MEKKLGVIYYMILKMTYVAAVSFKIKFSIRIILKIQGFVSLSVKKFLDKFFMFSLNSSKFNFVEKY